LLTLYKNCQILKVFTAPLGCDEINRLKPNKYYIVTRTPPSESSLVLINIVAERRQEMRKMMGRSSQATEGPT
jgi:hypothetical protein